MNRLAVLLSLVALACGCDRTDVAEADERAVVALHRETERKAQLRIAEAERETELRAPCTDLTFNAANQTGANVTRCPRPDQRLTFEADADNDAWIVCRCVRGETNGGSK
jgi:hypothetical protein